MSCKKQILLLEDDEAAVYMMKEMLSLLDYEVDVALNAHQAINYSKSKEYDYYLIDIIMEGEDGFQAIQSMNLSFKAEKIIMVSANLTMINLQKAKNMGISRFVPKPIKMNKLKALLV